MCFPCVSILLGEWFFLSGCVFLVFLFYLENGSFFLDVFSLCFYSTWRMVLSFWMCFPCVSILLGEWFFLSGCVFLVFLFYLENGSFFLDVFSLCFYSTWRMVLSFWMCFPCVSILLGEWFFLSGCVFLVFLFYLENGSFFLDVFSLCFYST